MPKATAFNVTFAILAVFILILVGMNLDIIIQAGKTPEVDYKIRYSELLNWISTLIIGFFVSYVLKNRFENDKTVKNYLLDDIKKISQHVEDLKEYCFDKKKNHSFTENQRKDIDSKINLLDKRITIFCNFLKECYRSEYSKVNETLVDHHNDLNKKITGEDYYSEYIEDAYFDNIVTESSLFESSLRKLSLKIIKDL